MRRVLRRMLVAVLAVIVLLAGFVAYLGVTTPDPREAPGWERLPDLPDPRGEFAATVGFAGTTAAPRLVVAGGLAGLGRSVAMVNLYDPVAKTWSRGPELPDKRHHPAAAAIGPVVYVSGGSISATDWRPERNLWSLSLDGEAWESQPEMPEGRMGHQMAAVGGALYVIGGRGETANVLIYEPATRTWRTGAEMPVPRDHLAIAVVGTRIYAIGGRDDGLVARVDVYETVSDSWCEGRALPTVMSAMAAGATNDGIHVVGGEDPQTVGGGVIDRHWHLLPGGTSWQEAPLPPLATHGSAHAVLDGRLVIVGGARRQGALSPLGWTGVMQTYLGE